MLVRQLLKIQKLNKSEIAVAYETVSAYIGVWPDS